jgi:hypothetical protein
MSLAPLVLVRGIGDVGSALAHVLFRHGYAVVIHDGPAPPTAHRRGMAFTDAVFDGSVKLDGIFACRIDTLDCIAELASGRLFIPLVVGQSETALAAALWFALVDARMRKRAVPECQRRFAPLTVGLGPGFIAGDAVDVAIETAWGDRLGASSTRAPPVCLRASPSQSTVSAGKDWLCSGRWHLAHTQNYRRRRRSYQVGRMDRRHTDCRTAIGRPARIDS